MTPPEARHDLPAAFAAALGQCVADFGWLEEVLKRAIHALETAPRAPEPGEAELEAGLVRMDSLADDTLSTLIDHLDAAMRRRGGLADRHAIGRALRALREDRNLVCHASWQPTVDPDRWHPAFVSHRGEVFAGNLGIAELRAIAARTREAGARIVAVMHAAGGRGDWAGDDG